MDPDLSKSGERACCFSGSNDDYVISGADDDDGKNLYVWSLLDGKGDRIDCTVNRSIRILPGHADNIACICCSYDKSVIVSCADDGVIKLWNSDG